MSNKLNYDYIEPGTESNLENLPSTFRINASSIGNFFDHTPAWYQEKFNNVKAFSGSQASVLGTSLHRLAELYSIHGTISAEDRDEIYEYMDLQACDDIDPNQIRTDIRPMWEQLKLHLQSNPSSLNEPFIYHQLATNLIVGGSIDSLIDLTDPGATYESLADLPQSHQYKIVDYKSTSAKSPITRWSKSYKFQQLVYAWVLAQQGINVTQIELLFITKQQGGEISTKSGKPLKLYPSTTYQLTEPVTPDDLTFIGQIIELISDSVQLFNNQPELQSVIAQDNRWKQSPPINKYQFTSTIEDI